MGSYKTFQGQVLINVLAQASLPGIKGWNRLEGRPRTRDFDETLRAEVRDPLWMLTRQWQMGEFNADDAGSPVLARVKIRSTRLQQLQLRDHAVEPYDDGLPLETRVEQETIPINLDLSLQIARYWSRLLQQAVAAGELSRDYRDAFKQAFGIRLPADAEAEQQVLPHQAVWQWHAATAGRSINGAVLLQTILAGGDILAELAPAPSVADSARLNELAGVLQHWWQRQYAQPENGASGWAPSQLEYQAALSAPRFDGDGDIILTADEYHHGHLDWHSFDLHPSQTSLHGAGEGNGIETMVSDFIPTVIEFGGMPNARWWEFENRKTDFGDVNADTTDLAKLLLIEFGLIYANDWFLLPFTVPVGTLSQVEGLAVTNVFGERLWIDAVETHQPASTAGWSMYRCNTRGEPLATTRFVFIPPAVDRLLQGAPIEQVQLVRDEVANMVWGIEQRLQLSDGEIYDGYEISTELLNYLRQQLPPGPGVEDNDAAMKYLLMNGVPENWIPFIPVRIPGADINNREIQLQRAVMLRTLPGLVDPPRVRPRGTVLSHNLGGSYFVHEEEVPRAGAHITRSFQRARWHDGKVCVWLGRRKQTGHGEGNSGLAFDQIRPKTPASS